MLDLVLLVVMIIYFSVCILLIIDILWKLIVILFWFIVGFCCWKVKGGDEECFDEYWGNDDVVDEIEIFFDEFDFLDEKVFYSYFFFYFVYFIVVVYVIMVLINWYFLKDGFNIKFLIVWVVMSIKMMLSFMCIFFYIWSLVVFILLYNKKFC